MSVSSSRRNSNDNRSHDSPSITNTTTTKHNIDEPSLLTKKLKILDYDYSALESVETQLQSALSRLREDEKSLRAALDVASKGESLRETREREKMQREMEAFSRLASAMDQILDEESTVG